MEPPGGPEPTAAAATLGNPEEPEAPSWCLCLGNLRGALPKDLRQEVTQVVKLAGPVFFTELMIFLIGVVSIVFCGHLGKVEYFGVLLALSFVTVTGISVGIGLASACDTLMSQSFGARNLKRVGVILQRGILILMLCCFPCWAIFINTEHILLLLRQDPEVSRMAHTYVMIFIPALPAAFLFQLLIRYLEIQNIILPQMITLVLVNVLNVILNYLLLYVLDLGIFGCALANTMSQYLLCVLLFLYIWWRKLYISTWGGWSRDCFQEWGSFFWLAVPNMFMVCVESCVFATGTLFAGLIDMMELGAQGIIYILSFSTYTVSIGLGVAAGIQVGSALGARKAEQARQSCMTILLCACVCGLTVGVFFAALKDVVGYIFTSDEGIIALVSQVLPIFVPFCLFDALASTSSGVLRGTGQQKMGAIFNIIGYFMFGFPTGLSLMFAAKLGTRGLWCGILICVFSQCLLYLVFIWKIDWNRAAENAQVRAGLAGIEKNMFITRNLPVRKEVNDGTNCSENIESEDHTFPLRGREENDQQGLSTVGDVLTVGQLIFYRGIFLGVAVAVLVAGISIRVFYDYG